MALTLYRFIKSFMVEKQSINGKDVWVKINPHPMERSNPNTIPTEYFTASYYLDDLNLEHKEGVVIDDEDGKVKLFESPVAALSFTRKKLESVL
jgi:hypothetical protein